MKKIYLPILSLLLLILLSSCKREQKGAFNPLDNELATALKKASGGKGLSYYKFPSSDNYAMIPQDPKNPITKEKVELGKLLFHETKLGGVPKEQISIYTYSCASCHHSDAGFQAGVRQGIGEGGWGVGIKGETRINNPACDINLIDVQPIRTPSALNAMYQTNMLWNGQFGATGVNKNTEYAWVAGTPKEKNFLGFEGLETQAIAGQGVHRLNIDTNFIFNSAYKAMFDAAFPDVPIKDRYTSITAGLAIAAYERTLMANEAPFQKWLRGETEAMTDNQKKGALIFFGEGGCYKCHNGPALNSMNFYALGMNDLIGNGIYGSDMSKSEHKGRGGFTGKQEDMYKFKVPQLYNLMDVAQFGHGATFKTIKEVIEYKNKGIPENPNVPLSQIAPEFKPLGLTDDAIQKLTEFIEYGLYDANLKRYVPTSIPSGLCFPNNDEQSRIDKGCQ